MGLNFLEWAGIVLIIEITGIGASVLVILLDGWRKGWSANRHLGRTEEE
jgi:hypothetical protein